MGKKEANPIWIKGEVNALHNSVSALDKNKNAIFGPNLVVFGQKILFFTGEIKSFVTHITENPPRHLVHIVFWSGIGQKVQKMAIFGPK